MAAIISIHGKSAQNNRHALPRTGTSWSPFFLRLFLVNHAAARRPRPLPNVPASTHRLARTASGYGRARDRRPATGARRKKHRALPNTPRRTMAREPRTANRRPAKTARGPWISGHRHRPKNRAARPNFRGPRRCGTSACAMFLANNYVKNGISSD